MKAPLNHFLWPKVSINFSSLFGLCTSEKLEKELHEMFPSGFPVVCSSGRVALYIAISETNYDRTKNFKLFPFASHCVINTVSRLTNPTNFNLKKKSDIIYHQWGISFDRYYTPLIEDSVDSLYEKKSALFKQGSEYEIWSLPKILGTSSGGVLWCKNESDAISIRSKIKENRNVFFTWILRLLSNKSTLFYSLWEGTEKGYKGLSVFQMNEIFYRIKSWDKLVENRKKN